MTLCSIHAGAPRRLLLGSLALFLPLGCAEGGDPARTEPVPELGPGPWRAALASPGGPLTFGIDLEEGPNDGLRAVLVNGEERRLTGEFTVERDELTIEIPPYRSRIVARITDGGAGLEGRWERDRGEGHAPVLAFAATEGAQGASEVRLDPADVDALNGRWSVQFADDEEPAVGIFSSDQAGNARGTFLTTLGDYRYLAGKFDGKRLDLSCFDGAHAFLFSAQFEPSRLTGEFWSRDSYHTTWVAAKDPEAELPDDFGLTRWTGAAGDLEGLQFPDLDGVIRSPGDRDFAADARLIVVFGSWCPNCNDLTEFLVELDARYEGLSILGLAFELGDDPEAHRIAVRDYVAHHGASYPVLICGNASKERASKALPILDRVRAYPTTIFLDRQGNVSAVHTGFSGPATGARHARLRQRFESEIESLLGGNSGR